MLAKFVSASTATEVSLSPLIPFIGVADSARLRCLRLHAHKDTEVNDIDETTRKIEEKYGILLTQRGLAELLDRTIPGLRWSLAKSTDPEFRALNRCARRVGRRLYYPAADVANIVFGERDAGARGEQGVES